MSHILIVKNFTTDLDCYGSDAVLVTLGKLLKVLTPYFSLLLNGGSSCFIVLLEIIC